MGSAVIRALVPGEVTVLFNQRTADSLGWMNSYQGLIVPSLASMFGDREQGIIKPGEHHPAHT